MSADLRITRRVTTSPRCSMNPSASPTPSKVRRQGQGRRHREGYGDHRRRSEDRGPRGAQGVRRPRPRRPARQGRRRGRGLSRPHRERAGRGRDLARQGSPRGEPGSSSRSPTRRTRRSRRHLQPGQGRLHRRPRRRRGLPAALAGRHPPDPRRRPADGRAAAVPDPQDGPPPRQHRRLAPHRPRRDPRRAALRAGRRTSRKARSVDGVVKNITDYGAFVDLGGIDGLLHVTDMAWQRVNHPSEVLTIGQQVKVQIIKINHETHRISLGMKQLLADPWEGIEAKYPVGARFTGRVTNITDYGAFVELEPGIEGLIHVSEMSLDQEERPPRQDRLHLAGSRSADPRGRSRQAPHLARPQADPAQPVGGLRREVSRSARPSRARSRTRPSSACSSASTATSTAWSTSPTSTGTVPGEQAIEEYKKGDIVKAKVLDVDVEKERISLGIKQLGGDPVRRRRCRRRSRRAPSSPARSPRSRTAASK